VTVAALVIWLCTGAVGSYLLATATRTRNNAPGHADPVSVPSRPVRDKDRFDPPSLQRAKSEPLPGLRDLAEFSHPALATIGFGFWLGFLVSHDRLFLAISLGILLGAICAGLSWFTANIRAARRAQATGAASGAGHLFVAPHLLILHAVGAILTLLFVALVAARG
jgi:hypothetical protein